jgi:hypothetical protein
MLVVRVLMARPLFAWMPLAWMLPANNGAAGRKVQSRSRQRQGKPDAEIAALPPG